MGARRVREGWGADAGEGSRFGRSSFCFFRAKGLTAEGAEKRGEWAEAAPGPGKTEDMDSPTNRCRLWSGPGSKKIGRKGAEGCVEVVRAVISLSHWWNIGYVEKNGGPDCGP